MAKTSILDLPIYTFSPDQPGQPHLAFINRPGRLPIFFNGKTPLQAHMAADNWRKEEVAKEEARRAGKEKRLEAAREARAAKLVEDA